MAEAAPKPARKLPFKPTAIKRSFATPPTSSSASAESEGKGKGKGKEKAVESDEDDDLALFRRSRKMAPIIAADRERRLAKVRRLKEEGQRRTSAVEKRPREEDTPGGDEHHSAQGDYGIKTPSIGGSFASAAANDDAVTSIDAVSDLVTPPSSKRSRHSSSSNKDSSYVTARASITASQSPSLRRLQSNPSTPAMPTSSSSIILLDSDDGEEPSLPEPISLPEPVEEDAAGADDVQVLDDPLSASGSEGGEFAEYIRKAKEQRERDRNSDDRAKVEVIVTSEIENSIPLCVMNFFDKPVNSIRTAWLTYQRRNNIQIPSPDDVILTWKRKRVYNYSTLRDLGLRPSGDGGVYAEGFSRKGLLDNGTRVHMEIWSPELFRKCEAEEASRSRYGDAEGKDEGTQDQEDQPPEEEDAKLRVVLAAPGYVDVKLTVRLGTTVETLVTGFRAAQSSLPPEKEVTMWFDGEKMEEHVTMEEAEIDDMDKIEVHVR